MPNPPGAEPRRDPPADASARRRSFHCVICRRAVSYLGTPPAIYPFCSLRCRMVDLGKWFNEQYGIETAPKPEDLDLIEETPANDTRPGPRRGI